ncbi:sigma-54-dependent Fis family transcriptional regulator [Sinirhodobacter populi]|uniref:Sigma-54-dependent Fis family transcriptional regulator n=1 Tax=Paenirhodobacter populi TaxID=2306993 RepID=A0A443KH56_9RHOB|nr:sigma-54 dependent transcriptional regulator [Sinirhodobacter populi]RWR32066.1 sigma-54-dependent Fis family transcriptional regulator [Sinirhodobacter populi]
MMRVMLIDDDPGLREALADSFLIAGIEVDLHPDGQSALNGLSADYPGVIVTDIRMPRVDGHGVLDAALARDAELPVILMTGHGDIAMAVAALKQGAFDFIAKPFATDHLIASVRRALETRRLVLENRRLRAAAEEAGERSPLLGETPVMRRLQDTIRQLANVDVDVLIEGETGTGKEVVARLLHRWSSRRARPFVAVDCAALPEAIADETLFGSRISRGRIAEADRGTLFLDNIGNMPDALQGRLLRVVEERELPVFGGEPRRIDLRILASAREDMAEAVAQGRFRADLLYRLEAVRLRIPPLRDRRADIGLLFAAFLTEAARQFDRPCPPIDAGIEARLATDDWPGNVRELRNFATQMVLGLQHPDTGGASDRPLAEQMDHFERGVLQAVLRRCSGDVGEAARILQLPRRSLYARLQRLGLDAAGFRKKH